MAAILNWLKAHKFSTYIIAFLLMVLPPIPLYFAANASATGWMIFLLTLIAAGNLLAVLTR